MRNLKIMVIPKANHMTTLAIFHDTDPGQDMSVSCRFASLFGSIFSTSVESISVRAVQRK